MVFTRCVISFAPVESGQSEHRYMYVGFGLDVRDLFVILCGGEVFGVCIVGAVGFGVSVGWRVVR